MGPSFFSTLIDDYLFFKKNPSQTIQLNGQNIIIDGYSFFYYMYYEILNEDKHKSMAERKASNQFSYDGLWEKFSDRLKPLKQNCRTIIVVFDGIPQPNKHRRSDPERESSIKFNDDQTGIPSLLHDEFLSILHSLNIPVHIASGEADPTVVQMAQKHQAFIVARDSDYYLYELSKGYIPLQTLDFTSPQGKYYQMNDVFHGMSQKSVALWATTIAYDFITLDKLERQFPTNIAHDGQQFRRWLNDSSADQDKRQRLTCQFSLLRYIQKVGEKEAFNKLTTLVSQDRLEFEQIIESYTKVALLKSKLICNPNQIPEYLSELYTDGKLDHAVIDILIHKKISCYWKGNHLVHINLLLPMCYMLLKWANSSIVTLYGQTYNPFELIPPGDLPLLEDFIQCKEKIRKKFILGCVDFALQRTTPLKWHDVHSDYKIWCSMIKLWLNTKTTDSNTLKAILVALITKRLQLNIESFPKPYYRYSYKELKNYFSLEACFQLRQSIKNAKIYIPDEMIEKELKECEQFYKELSMINQFSNQPFQMPPPHSCFNQSTSRLAVRLNQSKNLWEDVSSSCLGDEFLCDFIKELYEFVSVESVLSM